MKIVEINTVCGIGSTGKIAVDIYNSAKAAGFSPMIAYGRGKAPASINSYKIGNSFNFIHHVFVNFFQGKSGFASKADTRRFLNWLDQIHPDLLHLHNLHGFYLHVGMLFDYIKKNNLPVIWTLHDCWPLTGQCAFFEYSGCQKWQSGCYKCPVFRTEYPYSLFKDNSKDNYFIKKSIFTGVNNLTIITPSHWLSDIVDLSFLKKYPKFVIPNGIDLELFHPSSKFDASSDSRRIILGVANIWEPRKGFDHFLALDNMLDSNWQIVLIGVNKKQQALIHQRCKHVLAFSRTANPYELAKWYSHAYVYVNPTLEDNFPTTNLEALACGTPVITYQTGGSTECLTNDCGIVVEKGNIQKLKNAILSLEHNPLITSEKCRQQAEKYDKNNCFHEYIKLYQQILPQKNF